MKVTIRADGLRQVEAMLDSAADDALPEGRKVVGKGCLNIKQEWRRRWTGFAHAPALPYAVGYDVRTRGTLIDGEVGPDKDKRQGPLGNIFEFGAPEQKTAPRPGGAPALDAEAPRFEKAVADLGARLLEGR